MSGQLTKMDSGPAVAANEGGDIESLLRFAVEKGASVETIERMMAVRRELRAERAKEAFDSALAAFQSECPIIEKRKIVMNKDGRSIRYKFSPLDDIITQVKALLQRHGFSYSLDTVVEPGWVKAICKITHQGGHFQLSEFKVPIDPDAFMTQQQKFAAANTFAKRYSFCNGFGIMTGDEDIDGASGEKQKPAGPSSKAPENVSTKPLADELWEVLKSVRGDLPNWNAVNQFLWDETVIHDDEKAPNFTPARFREVITKAKAKLTSQP